MARRLIGHLPNAVDTAADYALVCSYGDYTTNLPLEDLRDGKAWITIDYNGDPHPAEHGGPARLLLRTWRLAVLVDRWAETSTAYTLVFEVKDWPGHLAGQHVDLRLTAEDGYSASRSYSLAAPADGDRIQITVQRLYDGEVSPLPEPRRPAKPADQRCCPPCNQGRRTAAASVRRPTGNAPPPAQQAPRMQAGE